ncbi:hypothetical protein MQE36_01635 [Zhouia spongiae]|uniref:Uncharacterized protein n=1 Tax=Zhouia spongiae TaxID=2202721 RepID=A0ABY3YPK2_9FLAO|nr:hypothetical protein [Zhouia spongiae]UNY99063.1 hypothetical protein MQE36_01635 [Zhouia spongiae]
MVEYENVVKGKPTPNPGGFGTKESISTIKELREKLAVLEKWKDPMEDVLVIREYEVINPIRARTGTIGPQLEKTGVNAGATYSGGAHQYEFYDYLGNNNWKKFVKCIDDNGIKLK